MSAIAHMPHTAHCRFHGTRVRGGALTIDECVEDVLPVLLDQVVDVTEDTAVGLLSVPGLSTASQLHVVGAAGLTTWRENECTVLAMNGSDCKVVRFNWVCREEYGWVGRMQVCEQRKSGGVFDLYLPGQALSMPQRRPLSTTP
jgi:hypothetical protein